MTSMNTVLTRWLSSGAAGFAAGIAAAWFALHVLIMPPPVCGAALSVITAYLLFVIMTGRQQVPSRRPILQGGVR